MGSGDFAFRYFSGSARNFSPHRAQLEVILLPGVLGLGRRPLGVDRHAADRVLAHR